MSYWLEILRWVLYSIMAGLAGFVVFWIGRELFRGLLKLTLQRRIGLARILFILLAALILLSLVTYNETDYTNLEISSFKLVEGAQNKGGVVGAMLSLWLYGILGLSSYFIPVILLLWGLLPQKYYEILPLRSTFLMGIAILMCILLSSWTQLTIGGGIVGDKINMFLTDYFGIGKWFIIGAYFLALLLTIPEFKKFVFRKPIIRIRRKERPKPELVNKPVKTVVEKEEKPKEMLKLTPIRSIKTTRPVLDLSRFEEAYFSVLHDPEPVTESESEQELKERAKKLEHKFEEFEVKGKITKIAPGPVITRYEYEPAPGIKVSKVASLADDIALSMKAPRIRIVAPIPGKSAIGIEVPNRKRNYVSLKEILGSIAFKSIDSRLGIVLGKDIAGEPFCADIAGFPHLLIAGATGSGKSVCINAIIASILYKVSWQEIRFLMIDPKRLELPVYNGIPHLVRPVISNAKEALSALKDVIDWMELRYREFAKAGVRDIDGYNQKMVPKKPYILIIVDELADLMIMAPRDIEATLTRLAQMSRAVGIHLLLATQRPSVDVITGLIKANFPARMAFQVASKTDSRTILDMNGAEKLLGKGDMLFIPPGKGIPERLHGAYISTQEAKAIANLWTERWLGNLLEDKIEHPKDIARDAVEQDLAEALVFKKAFPGAEERIKIFAGEVESKYEIPKEQVQELLLDLEYYPELEEEKKVFEVEEETGIETGAEEFDELFEEAKRLVIRHQVASVSLLQRHFKIGYARAGRIIDQLERAGIIGPYVGSKSRDVLVPREGEQEINE